MSGDKKSTGGGALKTFNLLLLIVILILIPLTFHQLKQYPEALPWIGRICAGLALVVLVKGVVKHAFRFLALVLLAGIALVVLVAEGIIEAPHLIFPE